MASPMDVNCKRCGKQVSMTQFMSYFKYCPDCYLRYKKRRGIGSYLLSVPFIVIGVSYVYIGLPIDIYNYESSIRNIIMGFMYLFVSLSFCYDGWLWLVTEMSRERLSWRKKSILVLPLVIILAFMMVVRGMI